MQSSGKIHIGTSGWHYQHWIGPFYPPGTRPDQMLSFYAASFGTVEINNSFYKLPSAGTFEQWRRFSPPGFLFAVKGSRYVTHMKRLKDPQQSLSLLMERAVLLEEKLGPVLFQMPPKWGKDMERLAGFLAALPKGFRFAFEFRDSRWFDPEVYDALRGANAAFCIYDLAGSRSPRQVTADWAYLRLHGPGEAYCGCYTPEALEDWAGFIRRLCSEGQDVYCYFDNDQSGYAPRNARELKALLNIE